MPDKVKLYRADSLPSSPTPADDGVWYIKDGGAYEQYQIKDGVVLGTHEAAALNELDSKKADKEIRIADVISVPRPKGGLGYIHGVTGAVQIKLPYFHPGRAFAFTVNLNAGHGGDSSAVFRISGYTFSAYTKFDVATISADENMDYTVRAGDDGSTLCVWIGEVDTEWQYSGVEIIDLQVAVNPQGNWKQDWQISVVQSFGNVVQVRSGNFPWADWSKLKGKPTDLLQEAIKKENTRVIRNAADLNAGSINNTIIISHPKITDATFADFEISCLDNTNRHVWKLRAEVYFNNGSPVGNRGGAYVITNNSDFEIAVRTGVTPDGNNICLIIGDETNNFGNSTISLDKITLSYIGASVDGWDTGWDIYQEDDVTSYLSILPLNPKVVALKDWVTSQGFLKQVNWGDIEGTLSNQTDLKAALESKGVQLTADQPNAMVYLKDSNGNVISSLNVGFLNNEGTTIFFNSATDEIELKDDAGNVLSSFPASALMTGVGYGLNLTGSTLELTDSANNVIDSVTLTISNIQGLQTALDSKALKTTSVTAGTGLTGGGDLSSNRTISLSSSTQSDIAKGVTAHSWGDHNLVGYLKYIRSLNSEDLDDLVVPGIYNIPSSLASTIDNKPYDSSQTVQLIVVVSGGYITQRYSVTNTNRQFIRTKSGSNPWTPWEEFATRDWVDAQGYLTSVNLNGYALDSGVIHNNSTDETKLGKLTIDNDFEVSGISNQGGIYDIEESGDRDVIRISNPIGGAFYLGSGSQTGAIKIELPAFNSGTMFKFTLSAYERGGTNKRFKIFVTGHNKSSGLSYTEINTLSNGADPIIRMGEENSKNCVWIGEVDEVWTYTHVAIENFHATYNGADSRWAKDWVISLVTSIPTTSIITHQNNLIASDWNKLKNIPNDLATETYVDNAIFSGNYNDLTNKPSLYGDWKLWTNGSQKTSIGSGGKVDFQAGANIHIGYAAGGVVTISVTGLQIGDIAGLVSELQKYASDIESLELLAHSHANKAILDGITQQDITNWNTNNATGKVDKSGDTMTGSLMFTQGSSPVVSLSSSAQVVFTALKASVPSWSFYQIINYNGNGDFESCVFHLSNPSKSLLTIGLIGIGVGVDPTESIDAKGTARLREVPNGTGDFARIDSTGVVKKRTLAQTKGELGLNVIAQSVGPIDFSSGQKVIYTATPGEVDVILPPAAEAAVMGEFEVTTSQGNNLLFKKHGDEGLEEIQVQDVQNESAITSYAGSVRLAFVGGEWYKLGA